MRPHRFAPRIVPAFAFLCALALAAGSPPAVGHADVPEADVACTGTVLLNDDLPPIATLPGHRVVSARAEILGAGGSPVGTLYLDDRGDRYAAFERGTSLTVYGDFGLSPAEKAAAPEIASLSSSFRLPPAYHLAACR